MIDAIILLGFLDPADRKLAVEVEMSVPLSPVVFVAM